MTNSRLLCISLVLITAAYCLPTDIKEKVKETVCEPGFCDRAKFDCSSCNGTLVPAKDPCKCCPACLNNNYIEEGDRCSIIDDGNLPPGENSTTSGNEMNKEIIKSEESVNKGKECRPGLICLLGTCVTLF